MAVRTSPESTWTVEYCFTHLAIEDSETPYSKMRHSDIATTLNIYTHTQYEDVEKEVREMERKQAGAV
ncbi:MAG: hypothetical protein NC548_32695 [Lachnospiraceae bacterium]|nr:hypothetical protein [Lachnospiraceae bacterium]